ncbi:MAG: ribosome maturation factor RimM [Actinomycetota bacterium]
MSEEPAITVGKITRAHGIKGEVSVLVLSENPDRFVPDSVVSTRDGRSLSVESTRENRGRLLVKFKEISHRGEAQRFHGEYLVVPASELAELPEGSYWPHQIIGCEVLREDGRSLGTVTEIIRTEANDVWVAKSGDAETLIPALDDVVESVDPATRRIVVERIPGLTADANE